ncbi:MAG: ammonia-forming cytochrome c nitrite reductase subunit c552 [Desulfatiglandaceae bacterium]
MKIGIWFRIALTISLAVGLAGCKDGIPEIDIKALTKQPKKYVGSDLCKVCHLEHYDSWRTTLHSRTFQDVTENRDALIAEINPAVIRADLKKLEKELKVPVDEVYIPYEHEIKYTIGVQWKQQFLVEKNGKLYIAPIQYNAWTDSWVNYHEEDWDKRPWISECGGCHAMGVDLEKNTFSEPSIGCEACHGPGSHHIALPKTAVFDKRLTIVNPSRLPSGIRTQICGSCHNRGESTKMKGLEWPVGYVAGRALGPYYKSTSFAAGDVKHFYANEFAKGHHQQYIDWKQSVHAREGVSCTSCHYVHQLGVPPTQFQTKGSGSQQCLMCHRVINSTASHSIHSFGNCVGCHMPKIARSAESGDTHSHVFVTLLPKDTLKNPAIPNSCQTCHKHKNTDLATLQNVFDGLAQRSLLRVHQTR